MKQTYLSMFGVLAVAGLAFAAEKSLSVGDRVPAFNVRDITGPNKGDTLCYRCQYGARPVVTIFTRNIDDKVVSLVKKIDAQVEKNSDAQMASFVVLLTDDADAAEKKLEDLAKKEQIKNVPLTVIEGDAGPENFGIEKDAETTVMMWVENTLKSRDQFAKGKLDTKAVEKLAGATKAILE